MYPGLGTIRASTVVVDDCPGTIQSNTTIHFFTYDLWGMTMKKLLMLLIVVGLSYFGYTKWIQGSAAAITYDSDGVVFTQGDNTFYATEGPDYHAELRLFGIVKDFSGSGWNPVGHTTHMFMALPVSQLDPPDVCENKAVARAKYINVNAQGDELKDRLTAIEQIDGRRCVRVSGKKMRIEEFFYKDEDHTSSLTPQGKMDPRSVIVLNDIEVISCY